MSRLLEGLQNELNEHYNILCLVVVGDVADGGLVGLQHLNLLAGVEVDDLQVALRITQKEVSILGEEATRSQNILALHALHDSSEIGFIDNTLLTRQSHQHLVILRQE